MTYVVWKDGYWERAKACPNEEYAYTYDHLRDFVHELRQNHPDRGN